MYRQSCDQREHGNGAQRSRPRQAIAAVEFAAVATLLGLMLLGLFELSRGMRVREILSGAARKGCRTGILRQYGNDDITNDATNIMRDNGFDTSKFNPPSIGSITIVVTAPDGTTLTDALDAPPGTTVSVQVGVPGSSVNLTTSFFLTGSVMISDTVVMMKQ
jgi:Flp pilus assembly protein TadG